MEALLECNYNIVGVITKKASIFNSDFYDLSTICEKSGIDYMYVNNVNDSNSVEFINSKKPDLIYCFGWSQLISKTIIDIPTKGIIGFHPAELPHNRGRHPIVWALALGLEKTASTFFYITEGADDGDIISQEMIPIEYIDNAQSLYNKIMREALIQVKEFTRQFCINDIKRIPQDNSKANYWRKRTEKDGEIDWRMSATTIYNLIRSLTKPYVGAHFIYSGEKYKVWSSKIIENEKYENYENVEFGKVLKVYSDISFEIKTGDKILIIDDCDSIKLKEGDYLI